MPIWVLKGRFWELKCWLCGLKCPFFRAKTTEITKITKTTKTTQTATNKELSAGLAEITETTEMTKTTGIQGANHGFPKQQVQKYLIFFTRRENSNEDNSRKGSASCAFLNSTNYKGGPKNAIVVLPPFPQTRMKFESNSMNLQSVSLGVKLWKPFVSQLQEK